MILVAVSDDDAAQLTDAVGHVGDVRNDQVHTQHIRFREHEAGID